MSEIPVPAPAGRKIRAIFAITLLIAVIAAALILPAMAGDDECKIQCGHCNSVKDNWFLHALCLIFVGDCHSTCPIPEPPYPT